MRAGYWTTIWVSLLVGYCLYYTALLILTHLGHAKNMKESILAHFQDDYTYMIGYSLIIWFSFIPFLILRFKVICHEVSSLFGYDSDWIALSICLSLILLTLTVRFTHYTE